jgi:hypothetical protein
MKFTVLLFLAGCGSAEVATEANEALSIPQCVAGDAFEQYACPGGLVAICDSPVTHAQVTGCFFGNAQCQAFCNANYHPVANCPAIQRSTACAALDANGLPTDLCFGFDGQQLMECVTVAKIVPFYARCVTRC